MSRDELIDQLLDGAREVLEHLQLPDADLGGHRRDRLAGGRRGDHEPDPALPLLVRPVCARDGAHLQGRKLSPAPGLRDHADARARHAESRRHGAGRARPLVVAVDLMMFGPSDADSKHTAQSMRWKIKRFSNDELRQKFVDVTAPQAEFLGLKVPDPELRWDEARRSTTASAPSTGRSSRRAQGQRALQPRAPGGATRKAHEDGRWVREAAVVHAREAAAAARAAA